MHPQSTDRITHHSFYSPAYQQEIGYNVYLPPAYDPSDAQTRFAVQYHLHGYQEDESTDVPAMLPVLVRGRRMEGGRRPTSGVRFVKSPMRTRRLAGSVERSETEGERFEKSPTETHGAPSGGAWGGKAVDGRIVVFPNNTPIAEGRTEFHDEEMLIDELIPLIDREYHTLATREHRHLSGFSMGGNMAFCYALKHRDLFSSVTAYAGTYHHSFGSEPQTVGAPRDQAAALYEEMLRSGCDHQPGNVLCLIRENADWLRQGMQIELHVGSEDILICDNEIVHRHLDALALPHAYRVFDGVGQWLGGII
jgi:S-formylglutathione hydrolase FrmB